MLKHFSSVQFNSILFLDHLHHLQCNYLSCFTEVETQSLNPHASKVARKNSLLKGRNLEQQQENLGERVIFTFSASKSFPEWLSMRCCCISILPTLVKYVTENI